MVETQLNRSINVSEVFSRYKPPHTHFLTCLRQALPSFNALNLKGYGVDFNLSKHFLEPP